MKSDGLVWTVKVHVDAYREGSAWVATCPLDVASHGGTRQEAHDMLKEALTLFFEGCLEHGILWDELESRGLAPTASSELSMKPAEHSSSWLNIPIWLTPDAVESQAAVR